MRKTNESEKKIEELLKELTLEEKVAMCHGNSKFNSEGCKRLNIEELSMMDGPHGVRSEPMRDEWTCLNREEDRCTYLPTESALAATFNPSLARKFGETLGSEARYRGKDIILGPGVNIMRTPLCGRNFEYMSEDPCVISKLAPELVKGIESQDVASCVKHFAVNNQELDRGHVNAVLSDRALHEIYLKGFYSAIIEGGASSVMGAYNRYKGQHLCHNEYLVNDILKDKWGFDGVYLSDWGGCHDTDEAIYNGLDIEMGTEKPYNEYYLADAFLEKVKNDEKVREILDDKVRRILRLMFSVNKFNPDRKMGEFNTPKHQKTAYDIALEAMVLLKNEDNLLPLNPIKTKKILVIGPNATAKHSEGGSSSGIRTVYEVTPLEGIKNRFGKEFEIEYESGDIGLTANQIPTQLLNIIETGAGVRAFKQTAYRNENGKVEETVTYTADAVIEDKTADSYKLECNIKIPESGKYLFKLKSTAGIEFYINGKMVFHQHTDMWNAERGICGTYEYAYQFKENEDAEIVLILKNEVHNVLFDLGWNTPSEIANVSGEKELFNKAKEADCIIYCGGLNHSLDTEGADKRNMELPAKQNIMIEQLLKYNQNVAVILTAGSPVEMPWINEVKSVVWGWYAGMEGGNALADILLGNVVPSGKMPFTLPVEYEDCPVARYGEYKADECKYNEDIFVGYRGFEKDKIKPLFPFGHGLSYTDFEYSDLRLKAEEDGINISFKVKNKGNVTAMETAQIYIGDTVCSVERPPKELCDFKKVELKAEETAEINIFVNKKQLSFYDETVNDFKFESGEFSVFIGSSSEDIRLKDKFNI